MARVDSLGHFLTDVADAIRAKAGTSGTIQASTFDTAIANIPTGGSGVPQEKDVNFYDYDGTLVYSYTKADFLELTELPANPSHNGLTAQGWNWSLTNAKTFVTSYNKLNIGQLYTTSDGALKIYISLSDGRLAPYLGFTINGTATVDWGDNSTPSTVTSGGSQVYTQHTYMQAGDYVISISSESTITLTGSSQFSKVLTSSNQDNVTLNYISSIKKVFCPNNTVVSDYAFNNARCLEYVILPSNATSVSQYAFKSCQSLRSIQIPTGVTSIGSNGFSNCTNINNISIPYSTSTFNTYAFEACRLLKAVSLANNPTLNNYAFGGCYSLETVSGLARIHPTNLFQYCYLLKDVNISYSGSGVGGNAFQQNYGITTLTLPSTITQIGSYSYSECTALTAVTLLGKITSVGSMAFNSCYGVKYYDFSNCVAVPTLTATNAFQGIASDCKIIVPDSLYDTWTTASKWSTFASYIIKKSVWDAL